MADPPEIGLDVAGAKRALREADAVCFDVDSTVCAEEGIDVLAAFCGAGEVRHVPPPPSIPTPATFRS